MINQQRLKKTILFKEKREGGLNLTKIKIYVKYFKFQSIYKLDNEDVPVVHDYKISLYGRVI